MIDAQEKGRRLHITVGDAEDAESFVIEPVDVKTGAALLADFLQVASVTGGDDPTEAEAIAQAVGDRATQMAKLAVGEANYERVQALRSEEAKDVVYAALFWNTEGGGTGAMNAYIDGGLPKALSAVFAAAGLLQTRL